MCKYENKTDKEAINDQITTKLRIPEHAATVMNVIDAICAGEDIKQDRMSQWLGLLSERGIDARRFAGKKPKFPLIEIYPSGTHGLGGEDRMFLEIRDTEVEVTAVGISKHKK